mgnify:CR=1 FL=1
MEKSYKNQENSSKEEILISAQEYTSILNMQQRILSMLSSGEKSTHILNTLCFLAEKLLPNAVASIMIVNENGLMSVLCAPSIPKEGQEALTNLKPGPGTGSCGNAVFCNEAQFVQNTFEDKRWLDLKKVAIDFNICSCWSIPIKNEENITIGTFALSSFEHREPNHFFKKLLETAAFMINIILKKK